MGSEQIDFFSRSLLFQLYILPISTLLLLSIGINEGAKHRSKLGYNLVDDVAVAFIIGVILEA